MKQQRKRPTSRAKHVAAITSSVGERIASIDHIRFYIDGEPDDLFLCDSYADEMELGFHGGERITLFAPGHDGSGVGAEIGPLRIPESYQVDGEICEWRRESLLDRLPLGAFVDEKIVSASAVFMTVPAHGSYRPVGWRFDFENGQFLVYWTSYDYGGFLEVNQMPEITSFLGRKPLCKSATKVVPLKSEARLK